jgi:hypothetical protein
MGIGIRLRKLWRLKLGLVVSVALAVIAAMWSVEKISVLPPGLSPRSLEMATAVTHVLVDTPSSAMVDLRQDTYSVDDLKDRAVVLGNVIASSSVEARISQRAHLPPGVLRIQAPLTPAQSSPPVDSQNARHTTDILKSTDQYRIELTANPTVPMIDVYAQAPDAETAATLANGAVDELKIYLAGVVAKQNTPTRYQIRPVQLGRATGVVINRGVKWQAALIAFLLTLGIASASVTFLARVRAGWRQAALDEQVAEA